VVQDITEAGVDRILAAVGRKFATNQVNKAALLRALTLCRLWHMRALFMGLDQPERKFIQKLEVIRKPTKRLVQLLTVLENQVLLFALLFPDDGKSLQANLSGLLEKIDRELAKRPWKGAHRAYRESFKAFSPFDWLAGLYLPDVYELALGHRPSTAENGPSVRFVEAALAELKISKHGKPYSRASIARSIRSIRARRTRRKSAGTAEDHCRWWRPAIHEIFETSSPSTRES
jgi:hypothetical protein